MDKPFALKLLFLIKLYKNNEKYKNMLYNEKVINKRKEVNNMQKTKNNILKSLKILTIIAIIIFTIGISKTQATYNIEDVFNREYWEWHTRTTTDDKAYNGEHIQISGNKIIFYGYGVNSYKDFLYKEFNYTGKKIFKIIVDESQASYHTLEGAGFLVNSIIKDNKISGYVILYAEKTIDIYRIDDLDLQTFKTAANAKVSTYGTLVKSIEKQTSGIHNVVVEATPTKITVTDNEQTTNVNLDYSKHVGNSFGLIASYVQHDCEILSKIIFEKLEIGTEDYYIIPVETVNKEEQKLSGAKYEVKNQNGEVVISGTSNSNGIYNMEELQEGEYTITQTTAPTGYILNKDVIKFKVTKQGKVVDVNTNQEIKIKFVNEKEKVIIETNNTINNNISNTVIKENPDNTNLQAKLPQTGENVILPILLGICTIAIIYFAIKIRKYSGK